jgi:hypothetical protein
MSGTHQYSRTLVLGYHGCDKKVGEALISGQIKKLNYSTNTYDWIGSGAYFFENDLQRAEHFAKTSAANPKMLLSRGKIKDPFVVGAVIDLGLCLDLSRQEGIQEASNAAQVLKSIGVLPTNEESFNGDKDIIKRKLDKAIINYLHEMREDAKEPPYDTVRCPFPQGDPIAPTSAFVLYSHVQIAVRNSNSIIGFFLPRKILSSADAFKTK